MVNTKIFKQQEQFIKAHGDCRGIIDKSETTEVYYIYKDSAYRILYGENDTLVHVNKISIDEMERLLACANLNFGE